MEKKRLEKVDRISELPEPILHQILSFLSFKEVAQTCVLSKKWERAWHTYPVLDFNRDVLKEYSSCSNIHYDFSRDELRRRNELFICLAETMRNRHCRDMIDIKKFTLELVLSDDREFRSFVDQCICHAVGCNVKELKLVFKSKYNEVYNLPQILLFANSVEDLMLEGCKLESPRNYVKLSSLRKLFLSKVHIDDHMIKNLFGGCPSIESINFESCKGFRSLELVGLTRLHEITLDRIYQLEWLDVSAANVCLLEVSVLATSCKINLAFCKKLTNLTLNGPIVMDEGFYDQISELPVLEFLSISFNSMLKSAKISNSRLKELKICACMELVELNIDTPTLHYLYYEGAMIILSAFALALSKIDLWFWSQHVAPTKYIKFLANFHHFSEVLNLEIGMSEYIMVPREVRETMPSPLSNLEHWNLRSPTSSPDFTISNVVDSMLWFAPHTKSISVEDIRTGNVFSFEFTYKKQLIYEGGTASCCRSLPISCWHHCLEAVSVEFNEGSNRMRYALEGAYIWETIFVLGQICRLMESG